MRCLFLSLSLASFVANAADKMDAVVNGVHIEQRGATTAFVLHVQLSNHSTQPIELVGDSESACVDPVWGGYLLVRERPKSIWIHQVQPQDWPLGDARITIAPSDQRTVFVALSGADFANRSAMYRYRLPILNRAHAFTNAFSIDALRRLPVPETPHLCVMANGAAKPKN